MVMALVALTPRSGQTETRPQFQREGNVVGSLLGAPTTFDPVFAYTHSDFTLASLLFDTLYRVNADGQPYVLEVNPCPDLSSNAGLARMGRAFGWSYDDLVLQIVDEALMRSQSHRAAAALVSGVTAA